MIGQAANLDANLEMIIEMLPADREGAERRKHSLTRDDGVVIANMIKIAAANQGCSIGLTQKQMEAIRNIPAHTFTEMNDIVKERKRLLNALGAVTLSVLAFIGHQLFTRIDWRRLGHFITGGTAQ